MITRKRSLTIIALSAGFLLLIPLIAMQFSDQVNWDAADFGLMGLLLLGTGLTIDLVIRTVRRNEYRVLITALILIIFLLIWAELGVGIFGTPFAGS